MHKKHSDDIIKMLKDRSIIDWENEVPHYLKYGVYCKKELYQKEGAMRQRMKNVSFKISYSDDTLGFLLAKNFPDDDFINELYVLDITDDAIKITRKISKKEELLVVKERICNFRQYYYKDRYNHTYVGRAYVCEDCGDDGCQQCVLDDCWEERCRDNVFLCDWCYKMNEIVMY
jgi:hypothetical protein